MYDILFSDFLKYTLPFLLLINILALISFPFTNLLFNKNPDRGYSAGYILGIVFISWIYFFICTLAYIFEIEFLRFKYINSLFISISIWFGINLYLFKNSKQNFRKFYKFVYFKQSILVSSLVFIVFYFINSFTFTIVPTGSENFMNLGVLNSIFYSNDVPINDFWYSGEKLNYYYFGQFIFATILKILLLRPNEGFMMLIAVTPTLFLTSLFIVVKQIYLDLNNNKNFQANLAGFFAIIFITLTNPLKSIQAVYEYLFNLITINDINQNLMKYSVRVLDNTIAENYNYAFFINPLHAHTTNLILAILVLNLIYNFFSGKEKFQIRNIKIISIFFIIGVMFTISSWDLIIYLGLFVFILFLFNFYDILKNPVQYLKNLIILIYPTILGLLAWILYYIPSAGIPGLVKNPSSIDQFLGFWGLYLFLITLCFIFYLNKNTSKFLNSLVIFSILILIFLEVVYISDANNTNGYERANTYYKFSNAVILFLTIPISVYFTGFLFKSKKIYLKVLILLLILSSFIFSIFLIKKNSNRLNFRSFQNQEILLKDFDQNLYEIFKYIETNKKPNLVILEGAGKAYTKSNYLSTLSGIPTVFGWDSHEYTWRFNKMYLDRVMNRIEDVKTIYTSDDLDKTNELLNLYKVNYLIVSNQERNIYKDNLKEEKLLKMGEIVFQKENNYIIKR